jgi:hypothetical protein
MFSFVIVAVEEAVELRLGGGFQGGVLPDAFILDCPVEALNVGVVVGSADAAVAKGNALRSEHVMEVPLELWAVVGLDGREGEAYSTLGA